MEYTHLGRSGLTYEDLCGKGAKQIPFSQVDIERAARYSGIHSLVFDKYRVDEFYQRVFAKCSSTRHRIEISVVPGLPRSPQLPINM